MLVHDVDLNVEHLSTFTEEEFLKEFSTEEMKEAVWPKMKDREKFLKELYTKIKPAAKEEAKELQASKQEPAKK